MALVRTPAQCRALLGLCCCVTIGIVIAYNFRFAANEYSNRNYAANRQPDPKKYAGSEVDINLSITDSPISDDDQPLVYDPEKSKLDRANAESENLLKETGNIDAEASDGETSEEEEEEEEEIEKINEVREKKFRQRQKMHRNQYQRPGGNLNARLRYGTVDKLGPQEEEEEEEENGEVLGDISYSLVDNDRFQPFSNTGTKLILMWTNVYMKPPRESPGQDKFASCEYKNCYLTSDHNMLASADAVMFHMWNLRLTKAAEFPPMRFPRQRWAVYGRESPQSAEMTTRYDGLFNMTYTYRSDSDIKFVYGCYNEISREEKQIRRARNINFAKGKYRLAAWVVSHCNASSLRDQYVAEVQRYARVDVYGKCGTLSCFKRKEKGGVSRCYEYLTKKYKFYFALENSLCRDYVTEKAFTPLLYGMVPIVLGDVDYVSHLPPNSFIDIRDFASPKDLANYLIKVDNDDELYNSYFKWRLTYDVSLGCDHFCHMCEYLHRRKEPKVYGSAARWWNVCSDPRDFFKGVADMII